MLIDSRPYHGHPPTYTQSTGAHAYFLTVIGEIFGHNHWLTSILVFASPTGYMFTSSGFPILNWGIIFYKFLQNNL